MTPSTPAFPAWQRDFALLTLAGFTAFAFAMMAPLVVSDGDTYWHLATGRWILAHHGVPATDPFSYTAVGRPWVTHEWLSEVVMALFYNAFGWGGLRLLTALASLATALLLANRLRRSLPWLAALIVMAFSFWVLLRHVLERPHMIALPILVLWTLELMRAREQDRTPSLCLLPLMVLWANLHASYVFGIIVACFFALEAFLGAKGRRFRTAAMWGGFIVAAIAAALLTPNGFDGLVHPMKVMTSHLQAISEWRQISFAKPAAMPVAFFAGLAACLYLGVRLPAVRLGLLLLLLQMTFVHIRQEIVLAVIAPLLLAEPLARALERNGSPGSLPVEWPPMMELAAPFAVVILLFIGLTAWRFSEPNAPADGDHLPVTALEHTPAALRAKPVFNDYAFGGWLIFNGVRPFIDGRSDMYGDDQLDRYLRIDAPTPAGVDQTFDHYGIAWSILGPKSGLAPVLAAKGWKTIYADKWAIVQARPDAVGAGASTPVANREPAEP